MPTYGNTSLEYATYCINDLHATFEFESITTILKKHLEQISKANRQMLKKEYTGHLLGLGKTLIYNAKGIIFKGVVKDVDDFGHITVENVSTGESQKYDFKEIELVIPEQNKLTE